MRSPMVPSLNGDKLDLDGRDQVFMDAVHVIRAAGLLHHPKNC